MAQDTSDINDSNRRRSGTSVTLVIACLVGFLAVLGSYMVLEILNKPTAGYIAFLAFALAGIPSVLNLRKSQQINTQTEETKTLVEKVEKQTNGVLNAQFANQNEKIDAIQRTLEQYRAALRDLPIPEQRDPNA